MFKNYVEQKRKVDDDKHMKLALDVAESAKSNGEQARGAVLVMPNRVFSEGNSVLTEYDPTCHAEMNVIRKAIDVHHRSLKEAVLYSTIEPCAMCCAAAITCGIREIIFGAYDEVNGFTKRMNLEGLDLQYLGGILAEDCYKIATPSLRENLKVREDETPVT